MFVVAGVTGHVGSIVAKALLEKKQPVKVIVRDAQKGAEWSKRGAEVAVGSLEDAAFLTTALKNAKGFFTLLPPNYAAQDFYAFQRKTADAIGQAVKASGVKNVVILSSVGADLDGGNGPIKGLNYLEKVIRGTNAHLTAIRAGYFQENALAMLEAARQMSIMPCFSASADYPFPMIATKDIGALAAKELMALNTKSENVDLHGPAYSIRQVAEKLGARLGKKLNVVEIPAAGHVDAMMKAGFSKHIAEVYAEMYQGFNTGKIMPRGDRMVQGTTTIDETFAANVPAESNVQNVVGWFEIPVKDMNRSKAFYEHVFGVKLALNEMGPLQMAWFPMHMGAAGATGSLVKNEMYVPSKQGTLVYFSVDSIEAALARVQEKGGKVLNSKKSIGEHGFVAHFEDSEGNWVALHSMK